MSYSFDQANAAQPPQGFKEQAKEAIPATVRMISGCEDHQTSADVQGSGIFQLPVTPPGDAGGAASNALMSVVMNNPDITWLEMLEQMREKLASGGFDQIPQLSSGDPMDVRTGKCTFTNPNPNGRYRSLLIGINYVGQQGELSGCHNDVDLVKGFIESQGFPSDQGNMRILKDDGVNESPTRANILSAMNWLTEGAQAGDSLFMHYSGHGGQETDYSGDEESGLDDTLVPLDYQENGQIIDDIIFEELVLVLCPGVHLMCIMDCCHSGTVLDLPYICEGREMSGGYTAPGAPLKFSPTLQMSENPKFSFGKMVRIAKEKYLASQTRQNVIKGGDKLEYALGKVGAANGVANLTAYVTGYQAHSEQQKTITFGLVVCVLGFIAMMMASTIYGIMFLEGKGK